MRYLLKLSKEHPTLPKAELDALLSGAGIEFTFKESLGYSMIECEQDISHLIPRLAYTKKAIEYIGSANHLEELSGNIYDNICDFETFRISSDKTVEKKLGYILSELGLTVDLGNPEIDIEIIYEGGIYHAGLRIDMSRSYESRRPQHRPYFSPTSLHPKLARALVNLTEVVEGDKVLDPFCGTGGILIEAAMMGLYAHGWDIEKKAVKGSLKNLEKLGLDGVVVKKNVLEGHGRFDSIATDPPYGRSSRASEDVDSLISKFMDKAREYLDDGSRMSMICPEGIKPDGRGFLAVDSFDIRVHKSLTRVVYVFEAI
jgi:tRNA (guanine10-N2)-dimethyltransferase